MGVDAQMAVLLEHPPDSPITDERIKAWSADLAKAFDDEYELFRTEPQEFAILDGYHTDTPTKTLLFVHLLYERFYGPGYERGRCDLIIAIAAHVEAMTGGRIFYGSDSTDRLSPFGPEERAALLEYKNGPHGDDYHKRWEQEK